MAVASGKVTVGNATKASEYNNLRKDMLHAGYYPIDEVTGDATEPVTEETVGDTTAAGFAGSGTTACFWDMLIPQNIDTSLDWELVIAFDMATAESSKAVRLSLDYAVIDDDGDTTPSVSTLAETVTTPDAAETLESITLATIKIPAADLVSGSVVTCKLSRLADNAADTHTGIMRLIQAQFIQTQT